MSGLDWEKARRRERGAVSSVDEQGRQLAQKKRKRRFQKSRRSRKDELDAIAQFLDHHDIETQIDLSPILSDRVGWTNIQNLPGWSLSDELDQTDWITPLVERNERHARG
jgi:hypothetical protein